MKKILLELENYIAELEGFQKQLRRDLKRAPAGSLRTYRNNEHFYYYHRETPQDHDGKYIRKKNLRLIQALAQKDYDLKALASTENALTILSSGLSELKQFDPDFLEKLYQSMSPSRKDLIDPLFQTAKAYAEDWQKVPYEGKSFPAGFPEYYTLKGERVRSKSEILIADRLNQLGIPYRYEYPLYLKGYGFAHPDFTMLNIYTREVKYLEHLGMLDCPDYAEDAVRKLNTYAMNDIFIGDQLLVTVESSKYPLNMRLFDDMIRRFLY